MEYDLATDIANNPALVDKIKNNNAYAQNLYAAMCNMQWQKTAVWPILKDQLWSCTWRSSGGIVAELQGQGDYLSWYCSGMGSGLGNGDEDGTRGYVPESHVTDEIREDLASIGWHPVPWD